MRLKYEMFRTEKKRSRLFLFRCSLQLNCHDCFRSFENSNAISRFPVIKGEVFYSPRDLSTPQPSKRKIL